MKKLFLIAYTKEDEKRKKAFVKACSKLKVELINVDVNNFNQLTITPDDLLYRITNGINAQNIEKILVTQNRPKTLYKNDYPFIPIWTFDSNIVHQSNNIPIAKTIFIDTNDSRFIDKAVKELNGFPIVIKIINKSKGEGVLKADNLFDLKKMINKLIETNQSYILREYVDSPGISYRSIILGDKILLTYKNESMDNNDFRSNVNQLKRLRKQENVDSKIAILLIKAVKMLNTNFGAIDYAFDNRGNLKIFEVNFPCNFLPAQELSGIDIAKEIINFLLNK